MRFGHFHFDPETDRLGEGPLSEVYKAVDLELGRTVALKILRAHAEIDPQADQRFQREATHAAKLEKHPNIATIYEYGHEQGTSFIAMEYLQGRTLDKIIKDQQLGYEECLRIAIQVTSALKSVHEQNLIHRDLKPGNILLEDDGSVKLLDFGIARARDESGITQHGMLVGTVLYMSPEQVRGDELDFRSDIFSLGGVLYHVMTGTLAFPGDSFPEVCMAILDGAPARRPSEVRSGFPQTIEDFLMRCLTADPHDRFADAGEADEALRAINDELTGTSTRATALRGRLLIAAFECAEGSEDGSGLAGGVRKDLAAELERNRSLKVELQDQPERSTEGFDFVLRGTLSISGATAGLELALDVYDSDRRTKSVVDRVQEQDPDEWALQADLVRSALRTVRRRLSEATVRPTRLETRKVEEARTLARHSRAVLHRGTTKHLLSATSGLRRALDLDRYCALAYAALAEAMVRKFLSWDGDPTFLDEARDQADRALALDAGCAEAHTALGLANQVASHPEDAQREYRLAMQIDNTEWLAHRLLGAMHTREGNFKEAAGLLQRAKGLRPQHIGSYDDLYIVMTRLDRYEEGLEIADEGIREARRQLSAVPEDQDARLHLAMLLARLGQTEPARKEVAEALKRAPKDGFTAFHASCVYALLGDPSEAMTRLKFAQSRGYYVKSELVRNLNLDTLRGLPEFQELAS